MNGSVLAFSIAIGTLLVPWVSGPSLATPSEGWGIAAPIDADVPGNVSYPRVAIDSNGNAIAVWSHLDTAGIWASRYSVGGGWGAAALIGKGAAPDIAVDPFGNALAVWVEPGKPNQIRSALYQQGLGWGSAGPLFIDEGDAWYPRVAADSSGNWIAVWPQTTGFTQLFTIRAARYVPSSGGWGVAALIQTDDTGPASTFPEIAIDSNGSAAVVWRQTDGTRYNIWANRYAPGIGWATAVLLETEPGDVLDPRVAVDSAGNAIAVWSQQSGSGWDIRSIRYSASLGWETVTVVENGNREAQQPDIAFDAAGQGMAVWAQSDGISGSIWANRYTKGAGWGSEELIELGYGEAFGPRVRMDRDGNALVVWHQYEGSQVRIRSNQYRPGPGWGASTLLAPDATGDAGFFSASLAVDPSGSATAVWTQSVGARLRIWANRYVAPDVTPPPLHLTSPPDGTSTDGPTITVSGTTEPGALVTVNGVVAAVEPNGTFSLELALRPGENVVVATATDSSGNVASATIVVTFLDPSVGLREQLDQLNARVAAVTLEAIGVAAALSAALAASLILLYRKIGRKPREDIASREKTNRGDPPRP